MLIICILLISSSFRADAELHTEIILIILILVSFLYFVLKPVIVVMLLSIVFLLYNHQYFPYWSLMW